MTLVQSFGLDEPTRRVILLALAIEPTEGIPKEVDIVHLNKIIKLYLSESSRIDIEFSNYNMGAVSYEVEETLNLLQDIDIIEKNEKKRYRLTELGENVIIGIIENTPIEDINKLEYAKNTLNGLSYNELLYYMYMKFPDTKENSTQINKLSRMKKRLIHNLLEKGIIDQETAEEWIEE